MKKDMKRVYSSQNNVMAHHVRNLLGNEGIEAEVRGELLGTAASAFMPSEAWVEVWVHKDDFGRAEEFVGIMLERSKMEHPEKPCGSCGWMIDGKAEICRQCGAEQEVQWDDADGWDCPKCRERLEEQFDSCWSCGAEREE